VLALAGRVVVLRGQVVRAADTAAESPDSLVTSMPGRPLSKTFPPKSLVAP
jgi:ABC-type sugar transport system ATPase subunit